MGKPIRRAARTALALLLLVMLGVQFGCMRRTHQVRSVTPAGFLKDYSQMKKGKFGEELLVYVNPQTDFSKYDKIMIDPVTIWVKAEYQVMDLPGWGPVPQEDKQRLADCFYAAIKKQLAQDYTLATVPGPDTMRLRVAITETQGSKVVLAVISVVTPIGYASTAKRLVEGTNMFVGKASFEGELVDSVTGERLAAGVDRRAGIRSIPIGIASTWDDVNNAYDIWAKKLRKRLAGLRKKEATLK